MSQETVTSEDVTEAIAGKKVIIPLAGGGGLLLWRHKDKLMLTSTGKSTTLPIPDAPGGRVADASSR